MWVALKTAGCVVQSGGSEKNRLVTVNTQSDDLLPSCMLAAVFSTGQWLRRSTLSAVRALRRLPLPG